MLSLWRHAAKIIRCHAVATRFAGRKHTKAESRLPVPLTAKRCLGSFAYAEAPASQLCVLRCSTYQVHS